MSPTASIFHGLAVGTLLALLRAFGWSWEANALLAGALIVVVPLWLIGRSSRHDRRDEGGPPPLPTSERWAIAAAFAAVVVPSAVIWATGAAGFIDVHTAKHDTRPVALALVLIAFACSALIFLSGLIDWFYVRPHLRGGRGSVCATSFAGYWRGLTRIWLLHRAAATLGPIAGITAIVALTANTWLRPVDETIAGAIAAVATIIAGFYITRTAPLLAIAINPPVQVGDVIQLAEEFNVYEPEQLREYFVVDVALEGVKLLAVDGEDHVRRVGRDAMRTHDRTIDVTDIAKLLRSRRPVLEACDVGCARLTEHCRCPRRFSPPPKQPPARAEQRRWSKLLRAPGRTEGAR
ncbi:MAG TPA: hypothetical protein VF587_15880 [Solirubrobacteraceae bacterium]